MLEITAGINRCSANIVYIVVIHVLIIFDIVVTYQTYSTLKINIIVYDELYLEVSL